MNIKRQVDLRQNSLEIKILDSKWTQPGHRFCFTAIMDKFVMLLRLWRKYVVILYDAKLTLKII